MLRLRLLVVAVVLAFVGLSARLFVWPDEDRPGRADAVVVLAGSHDRLGKGLELVGRRVAPLLVISDGLEPKWDEANRLCRRGSRRFRVYCFRAKPYSTRGEAEHVARLARRRGWRRVVVVTSRYHVTRARRIFRRCVDVEVAGVGADYALYRLPESVASEWVKLVYAETLKRGC